MVDEKIRKRQHIEELNIILGMPIIKIVMKTWDVFFRIFKFYSSSFY